MGNGLTVETWFNHTSLVTMESREDNTPLHVAAGTNNTTKLSQLLADQQCDP